MENVDDELYHMIGNNVRGARERTLPRLSQESLAKKVGLTRASIVNIEAGRQRAPIHTLWHLAESLGVELASLIPRSADLTTATQPIHLEDADIALIERAANGDTRTRRQLSEFVSRVKSKEGLAE